MAVAKIVELIGSSPKGWEDATKNALAEATKTITNIKAGGGARARDAMQK